MDVEALPSGTLLAGKFRVVRVLGTGGMGVVYEVIHELTHHRRALKLLHKGCLERPETAERFLREASAAGRIRNAHIIQTFDAGQLSSGQPYLVMELLEGQTVADRIEESGGLGLDEIVDVFVQACSGVHAAHEAGIVHRDLKPENLFLVERRGKPFVKVLDFGVSMFDPRHRLSRATAEGDIIGTPFYMSPEQIRGDRDLDGRSDVYALGVILYEAATGKHPYPAEKLMTLVASVLELTPRPLIEYRRDLPADLSAIVEQAMMKDRAKRTPSAKALGEALLSLIPAWRRAELSGFLTADPSTDSSAALSLPPAPSMSTPPSSLGLAGSSGVGPGSAVARADSVMPAKDTRASRLDANDSGSDVAQQTSGPMISDVLTSPEGKMRMNQVLFAALGTLLMMSIGGVIAWKVFQTKTPPEGSSPPVVAITAPDPPRPNGNLPEVSPAMSGGAEPTAEPVASPPTATPSSTPVVARQPPKTDPSAPAASAGPEPRPTSKTGRPAPNGLARKDEFKQ